MSDASGALGEETEAGPGSAGRSTTRAVAVPIAGSTIGRYVVLHLVGRGGMGVVLAAYDPDLDRKVALKLVRPDRDADAQEIEREAQVLARLRHPNLVTVHDVGRTDGGVFLAMEFVDGITLRAYQDAHRSWRAIVDVYLQAARGLAAVHEAGVVHSDFKPDNVLVGTLGGRVDVKLLDFGLARGSVVDTPPVKGGSAPRGTIAYMAPEQLAGGSTTPATDQFAFCVALYEALVGHRPFHLEALATRTDSTPTWQRADGVPTWLRRAVSRGLEFDPSTRHSSMHDLAIELERGPGRARRRLVFTAACAAASVAAVIVAARPDPCADADAEVRSVWTPEVTAEVHASMVRGFGGTTAADRVTRLMAGRIDGLAAAARQGCVATRAGDTLLEGRRQRCIVSELASLAAWSNLLRDPDPSLLVVAYGDLPPAPAQSPCLDDASLLQEPDPPPAASEDDRAAEFTLLQRLAEIRGMRSWDADRVEADIAALIAELRGRDDPTLLAEALLLAGWQQGRSGNGDAGYALLIEALGLAEAQGATRLQASIWRTIAENRHAAFDGEDLEALAVDRAAAAVSRLATAPGLAADIAVARGNLQLRGGRSAEAIESYESAKGLADAAEVPSVWLRASLAQITGYLRAKRIDDAVETAALTEAFTIEHFGPEHPDAAVAKGAHAAALGAAGRFAEGEIREREALVGLDRWGRLGQLTAAGISCNWCYAVGLGCELGGVVAACTDCARRVLASPTESDSTHGGLATALDYVDWISPPDAVALAREVAKRPVQSAGWLAPLSAAARVLMETDPPAALALATELCAVHGSAACNTNARYVLARLEPDPDRAAQSIEALRKRWSTLDDAKRGQEAGVGLLLAEHGHVGRDELAAVRRRTSSCDPNGPRIDAWLAAPAAPTREVISAARPRAEPLPPK